MFCGNYNVENNICLYLLEKFKDVKLAKKDLQGICIHGKDWKQCPHYIEQIKKIKS